MGKELHGSVAPARLLATIHTEPISIFVRRNFDTDTLPMVPVVATITITSYHRHDTVVLLPAAGAKPDLEMANK